MAKRKGVLRTTWTLIKDTFSEWSNDKAPRLGAALSYYTVFSLAPLLVIVISVAGLFLGAEAAQGRIVAELDGLLGRDAARVVQEAVAKAGQRQGSSIVATIVSVLTLLIGASGVMVELQDALNTIWKVVPKPGRALGRLLRVRVIGLALVLSFGFILLVSLAASAALAAVGGYLSSFIPGWVVLGYVLNYGLATAVIALFFALILKVLPDAKVAWRDVWLGALVTSVLFQLGKLGIGFYLGQATIASTFGAAGSLAVLLVWVYYSAQIVLLGAEFTRVWANRFGDRVVPDEHALPAPHGESERLALEKGLAATKDDRRSPPPPGPLRPARQ